MAPSSPSTFASKLRVLVCGLIVTWASGVPAFADPAPAAAPANVACADLSREITSFLRHEVGIHAADIKTLTPPPTVVVGARVGGDFSWGTFMRAVMAYSALSGDREIAGRDVPRFLGELGLIDAKGGAKTFSQLAGALTLREYGTDLNHNALWQSLNDDERTLWRSLLDPARFYDRAQRKVINLPENYLGVASRIVAIDYQLGLITDRAFVDDVLDRAAEQFVHGARYTDDALPNGRYDRYSQEYARFLYEAASAVGRQDLVRAIEPALTAVMHTWWDLVAPDGYGYPWGRTIGAVSYMDTMEIIAFLAQHPQFRPAPLEQLASVYYAAWQSLHRDYLPARHVLNIFAFGRGNYNYITLDREWQQTAAFFYKVAGSERDLAAACRAEGLHEFPATPALPPVARFEFFRTGDRSAGVWLVRQGALRFALPITTGTLSGIDDYLPAPHGLPGFAAPVEQFSPALVPYVELDDGRVLVAGDGADRIQPAADGRSVQATWRRWAVVQTSSNKTEAQKLFGSAGSQVDPGFSTTVEWTLAGSSVVRRETLTAAQPIKIKRYWFVLPSTADRVTTRYSAGQRYDRFASAEGILTATVASPQVQFETTVEANGDSPMGRGARRPIPLRLKCEARDVALQPGESLTWSLKLTSEAP